MSRSHSQPKSDLSVTAPNPAEIGGRIRKIRGAASQREFAGRLGISREQLSRIESGAQVPGTETLCRLAQITRVPVDFILFGGGPAAARGATEDDGGGWDAALDPLLAGTGLRLTRGSGASSRKADRAWRDLGDDERGAIRDFVRRAALVALAIEALLPPKAARAVTAELDAALWSAVVERILDTRPSPRR